MLLLVFILIIIGISIPAEMKTQISDFVNGLINSLGIVFVIKETWTQQKKKINTPCNKNNYLEICINMCLNYGIKMDIFNP